MDLVKYFPDNSNFGIKALEIFISFIELTYNN